MAFLTSYRCGWPKLWVYMLGGPLPDLGLVSWFILSFLLNASWINRSDYCYRYVGKNVFSQAVGVCHLSSRSCIKLRCHCHKVCPNRLIIPMHVVRGDLIRRSFGWDRENRGEVSQQVWHDKDPSLLRSKALSAEHRPKFCSPSPAIMKSSYEWKILERDVKTINNQS
jgi:hypothetical protein